MKRTLTALAFAAATVTAPALAATDTFDLAIDYSVSALDSEAQIEAEYTKIEKQVSDSCVAEHANFPFVTSLVVRGCTMKTMDKVVVSIDHDGLTELHADKTTS